MTQLHPMVQEPSESTVLLPPEASDLIDVVLEGGPAEMPLDLRICRASAGAEKIKVPYYGGYEHFVRPDLPARPLDQRVVYRWIGRTRVAE
jgi:hypothetical protein